MSMARKKQQPPPTPNPAPPISDEIAALAKDQDIFTGWLDHLENPDPTVLSEGRGKGLRLYDEVDRDPHAGSVLQTRYLSVAGEKWEISSKDESTRGKEIAGFITDTLTGCNFTQACSELLQSILYGFYCAEVMWKVEGGQITIDRILGKHPRRFAFTMDRELRLLTRDNAISGEEVPDKKIITFTNGDSDNPYGKGLGQKLWWPVWFKKHGIKFWLIFLDKFGMPTARGTYPAGATTEQKKTLMAAVDAIHSETGVIIPEGMVIELLEASRSGNVTYESLCEYMDKQISKAVLGQTLTTEVSGGSFAASQTHNEVRGDLKEADAAMLEDCLNRTLIRWLVDFNFAGVIDYPTLRFITEKEQTLKDLADRDEVLVNKIGVQVDDDYWYDTYNLPRPKSGAKVIRPTTACPQAPDLDQLETELNSVPKTKAPSLTEGGGVKAPSLFNDGVGGGSFSPEQQALENLADAALAATDLNGNEAEILRIVQQSTGYEEAMENLLSFYPRMNMASLQESLEKALFAADLHGRTTV
jgi:phage gp29-like protein